MQWRNTATSWGLVTVVFHWTMAALFAGQFALGWTMQGVKSLMTQFELYQWHKSFGFLILGLAILRLVWALTSAKPDLPGEMEPGERQLARATHWILYTLLLAVPVTGWAVVSMSPLLIPTYVFNLFVMPHLPLGISLSGEQMWSSLHAWLAYVAAFLVAVHSLAALRHHFQKRDGVLLRMLRPGHDGRREG